MGSVATQLRQKIDAAKKEQSQVSELERLKNRLAGKETFTVNPANSYAARAAAKTATTKTTAAVDYTSEINRLENLRRQAAVDLDMTTLNKVNAQMKAMRAAAGKQTVADRASDALSGAFNTAAGNYVNAAGTLVTDTDYNERQIKRLQESLASGRTSDGKVLNDAQRKTIQESIARMQAENRAVAGDPNNAANQMQQTADRLSATGQQQIASAKQGLGKVGQAAVDVGVAGAHLAGDLGLSLLIPGAGTASMAARSFGGAAQEARQAGASTGQQLAYGAGSALVSSLTEKIGNIGAFKRAFGSSALDLSKTLSRITQKPAWALAASILSEGGEEYLESLAQPVLQKLTYDPSAAYDEEWAADALYSAIIGGVLGGVGGSGSVIASGASRIGNTWAQSQNKAPQARQAISGDSNAPAQQNAVQGQAGAVSGQNNTAPAGAVNQNGLTALTEQEKANLASGAKNKIVSTFNEAVDFVKNALANRQSVDRAYLGKVPDSVAQKVLSETGINIKGLGAMLNGNDVRHIMKNHGDPAMEAARGQVAVTPEDIARIPEIIANPDSVALSSETDSKGRPALVFEKDFGDKFISIQGVSDGKHVLQTDTLYIQKGKARTPQYTMPGNQTSAVPVINAQSGLPQNFPNVNPTIPQSADSVNMNPPAQGAELPGTKMTGSDIPLGVSATREDATSVAQDTGNASTDIDPLLKMMLAGKRVSQETVSAEQFDALAERGDIGMDAGGGLYQIDPAHHIDQRGKDEVASRKVKAFQFDHPELQPYYRQAAEQLLVELNGAVRGGQTETATGEYGQTYSWRTKRQATERISYLLDEGKMSYSRIEAALDAIIHDKGQENYADAKRVELVLDDMLSNGYNDGTQFVPSDQDYLVAKDSLAGSLANERGTGLDGIDDGLGAANAGSLNSDYDNLQAQSSEFYPEGANAARPVDVPTRDFEGRNISKSASTVMGAQAIPDDVIPMIEQMVADGRLSYNRRSDQSAIDRARHSVEDKGFAGALEQFRNDVTSGKASKDTVVLGQTLLNNAANARDGQAVAEILSLYQSLNTNIGQAMQAASILRKLSPASQLYGVQRSVENMKAALEKQMGNAGTADIKIDDALVQKFLDQTDQAGRNEVMGEIYQNVADQVPSNWRDKWNAWRYLSMLGNPRTHIRNILGNVGFQPVRAIKNEIAAGLETALSAAGVEVERTKSFAVSPALYRAAWNDYSNAADILSGSKYDDVRGEIQNRRRIFDNGVLEAARKGNSAALEWEDAIFKRITYADSLAGYLKANGVTAAQMESGQVDADLLSRARDYAAQEALKATYQDDSAIARRTQKIVGAFGPAGEAVMPFKKTPANILSRALEYSPAGLAKSLTVDLRKVQKGDMSVSQALDNVAAGLTGSALFALGAYLFAQGLVTGGQGDGEDDKWAELLGHQGYALELEDGTSITLDWLAPESLPFFMGVEMMSAIGENGWDAGSMINSLWEATKSTSDPMLELSMMQGVSDLIESVQYADGSPMPGIIGSMLASYLSQGVPTILGQAERSTEDVRMTTYTDKNKLFPDLQYTLGRASSRLPLWDYNQIPYIDAWGREEETGDLGWRLLNNAANPAYVSKVEVDKVESELQRLRDATGETSVFPDRAARHLEFDGKRKDFTAQEYVDYAKELGQTSYRLISEAMGLRDYKAMSDGDKAGYIENLYKYSKAVSGANAGGKPLDGWQLNAQNAKKDLGVSTAEYIALYQKYGADMMSGSGYETLKSAIKDGGLDIEEFAEYKQSTKGLKADKDANGESISGSKKEKEVKAISGLSCSAIEKDWLYLLNYEGKNAMSDLRKAPWNQ